MDARRPWVVAAVELSLLAALVLMIVGPDTLSSGRAVGFDTRDLWDHLALLDQWGVRTTEWTYPQGGTLVAPDLGGMVLAAPFLWLGRGTAYTLATALQLLLACGAGWALGRRYGGGLVAGAVYGLGPYLINQAFTGEAETLSAWPLPIVVLLLLEDKRVAAGVVAAVGAVLSWYHGAFIGALLVGWVAWKRDVRALIPLGVFAAAVAVPAGLYGLVLRDPDQLFRGPTLRTYLQTQPENLAWMAADPADWLSLRPPPSHHHVNGFGWVSLGVGALGAWRSSERGLWLGILGVGAVLSLGPILFVAGQPVFEWMPGRLLAYLPAYGLMRLPHRWMVVAALGLAGLAAQAQVPRALGLLIGLETALFHAPLGTSTDISAPAVVEHIEGPVLELPLRSLGHDARGRYLLWQRTHGHPTAASLLMQGWSAQVADEPLIIAVCALDRADPIAERPLQAAQFRQADLSQAVAAARRGDGPAVSGAADRLRAMGFEQVVLYPDILLPFDRDPVVQVVQDELGEAQVVDGALLWAL